MTDGTYTVRVDDRPGGEGTRVDHLGRRLTDSEARAFLALAQRHLPSSGEPWEQPSHTGGDHDDLSGKARPA